MLTRHRNILITILLSLSLLALVGWNISLQIRLEALHHSLLMARKITQTLIIKHQPLAKDEETVLDCFINEATAKEVNYVVIPEEFVGIIKIKACHQYLIDNYGD